MARLVKTLTLGAVLLCAGCSGWQSALDAQGVQAQSLKHLMTLFVLVCTAVWLLVIGTLVAALRSRPQRDLHQPPGTSPATEKRMRRSVGGAVMATALIVLGLTVASFFATRSLSSDAAHPLRIRVRGYQWWWEITYLDERPDQVFVTANEIHIPVGRAIDIELAAADVIHSFWVPNLAGKLDLIPGRDNHLTLEALRTGLFRGQCAEFCGLQHAHMALLVSVDTPQDFARWRHGQLAPAATPHTTEEQMGQQVFTSKACAACHAIQGTSAAATIGPDLTHVASRRYIAAGLLEMTRGSLAAWVADPQTLKPGNNMPLVPLTPPELNAVSAYLVSLQ